MVAIPPKPGIGTGLYTPQEAAHFAKLRTDTFNRWFLGDARGNERVVRQRFGGEGKERVVTFIDLIQAVSVRRLRQSSIASKVTLSHIRDVVNACEREGIEFPLARDHTLYWLSKRLVLRIDEDRFIGLTPEIDKNQLYSGKIIEPFLKEVKFDDHDGLARVWTPLKGLDHRIDLNADRRFGMPIVEPCGILVSALVDAVETEGSIERAADAFEVEEEAVSLALKYQEFLQSAA